MVCIAPRIRTKTDSGQTFLSRAISPDLSSFAAVSTERGTVIAMMKPSMVSVSTFNPAEKGTSYPRELTGVYACHSLSARYAPLLLMLVLFP